MPDTHGDKSVILPSNERNENRNSAEMPFRLSSVRGLIIPLGAGGRVYHQLLFWEVTWHVDVIPVKRADPVVLLHRSCRKEMI